MESYLNYNNNHQDTILIVDDSKLIRDLLKAYIEPFCFNIIEADDGNKAIEEINKNKISLVITDIAMPDKNGFDITEYIRSKNLKIPVIMITGKEINEYLDLAIKYEVGNILSKPIQKDELMLRVYKLITKEGLFGLENYLLNYKEIITEKVVSSKEINSMANTIYEYSINNNVNKEIAYYIKLLLIEMLSNAVYHSHGQTEAKEKMKDYEIEKPDFVEVKYGYSDTQIGIGITDHKGILTMKTILSKFKQIIDNERLSVEAMMRGEDPTPYLSEKGRGLSYTRNFAHEYFFNIQKKVRTEIIIIFDKVITEFHKTSNYPIKITEYE